MPRPSTRPIAVLAALAALVASGCAGTGGPLATRRTTMGTLKADVARLEHQSNQQRERIAELEADKRRVSEQLAQEREANGDLTARLDDARMLMARQGVPTDSIEPRRPTDSIERVTPPTSRTRSSARKPPFAQISGGLRAVPAPEDEDIPVTDDQAGEPESRQDARPARSEPSLRWLPVATGLAEPSEKRR